MTAYQHQELALIDYVRNRRSGCGRNASQRTLNKTKENDAITEYSCLEHQLTV
jgi:hypothetical protein